MCYNEMYYGGTLATGAFVFKLQVKYSHDDTWLRTHTSAMSGKGKKCQERIEYNSMTISKTLKC